MTGQLIGGVIALITAFSLFIFGSAPDKPQPIAEFNPPAEVGLNSPPIVIVVEPAPPDTSSETKLKDLGDEVKDIKREQKALIDDIKKATEDLKGKERNEPHR